MATVFESVASSSSLTLDSDPTSTPTSGSSSSQGHNKNPRLTRHQKLSVLVVDDNLLNLRVMKQLLKKKMGTSIDVDRLMTASSGVEALELLDAHHVDLLFLDISMPGMSGIEVCRRLRQCHRLASALHVCAVTTDLADWQIELYRLAGMNGVIGKPLKGPDLEYAIRACEQAPSNTIDHAEPDFYFCRHGVLRLVPLENVSQREPRAEVERMDSTDTSTTATLVSFAPPMLQSDSDSLSHTTSDSEPKSRKQSVVSEATMGGVIAFDEPETVSHVHRRFERAGSALLPSCRPRLSRIDTSTTHSTSSSVPSSAPSAVTDPLGQQHGTGVFGQSGLSYPPALVTAPILTQQSKTLCEVGTMRRYGSLSRESLDATCLAGGEEPDIFAVRFGEAVSEYKCNDWADFCRPQDEHVERIELPKRPVTQKRAGAANDRWAQLADPLPTTGSSTSSTLSAVTRQLLTRRSQPTLNLTAAAERMEAECERKSKSRSVAGTPVRPSWQLVQLNSIYYQSVLKSGELLDEVLVELDLEKEQEEDAKVERLEFKRYYATGREI